MGWVRNIGLREKFWVRGKILGWYKILKSMKRGKKAGVDKIQVGTIVFPGDFGLGTIDFPEKRAKVQ